MLNFDTYFVIFGIFGMILFFTLFLYAIFKGKKHIFSLQNIALYVSFICCLCATINVTIPGTIDEQQSGTEIMFVLDVSKSMNVEDMTFGKLRISRLDAAKNSIAKFVLQHPQNRYGLVVFAGDALSVAPLTGDTKVFLSLLKGVNHKKVLQQGSDFQAAFTEAHTRMKFAEKEGTTLVFITDGADSDYQIPNILKQKHVVYFVVGVGIKQGGKIPIGNDPFGRKQYQQFQGKLVVSGKNTKNLDTLSSKLAATMIHLEEVDDLQTISSALASLPKKSVIIKKNTQKSIARYMVGISLLCFCLFLLLYIRNKRKGNI